MAGEIKKIAQALVKSLNYKSVTQICLGNAMIHNELDELYATAADEIASGQTQKGLWNRVFAEADGDEKVARARYLRERVQQLQTEARSVVPLKAPMDKADAAAKLSEYCILADLNVTKIFPASDGMANFTVKNTDRSKARIVDQVWTKSGYVDLNGNIKIQPKYGYASSFVKGFAYVSLEDGLGSEQKQPAYGVIDTAGDYVVLPNYQSATIENNDIYLGKGHNSNTWSEEFVFDPKIREVKSIKDRGWLSYHIFNSRETVPMPFHKTWPWQGRFVGKFGFVNRQGKWVIPAKYDEAIEFKNGRGFVGVGPVSNRRFFMIDINGKPVSKVEYDHVACYWGYADEVLTIGRVVNCGDVGYAHIDQNGDPLYKSRFSGLNTFNEFGFASATIAPGADGKVGLINKLGNFVFQSNFGGCFHLIDDLACVFEDGLYGIMNFSGEWIIKPKFMSICRLQDHKFIFQKGVGDHIVNKLTSKARQYESSAWYVVDRVELEKFNKALN